ncbi:MAG: trehalose-6-phosphate synthase [Dehalococcoidia bacterium]
MSELEHPHSPRIDSLQDLCRQMLAERRLIIASNRGPIEFNVEDDGSLTSQRGGGGMVTALLAATSFVPATWIATAMTEGDRRAAEEANGHSIKVPENEIYVRFVVVPGPVYQRHYYVFCNPLLWFVQHYMWNTPRTPNIGRAVYDAWENGYIPVNEAIADAIADECAADKQPPYVLLQDYHLYHATARVREKLPEATLLHFTHIPWPGPRYWKILPEFMRHAIHEDMCTADIVGLQTRSDVVNFLHCCESMLKDATIDFQQRNVTYRGRTTAIRSYPISIDAPGLLAFAQTGEVKRYAEQIRARVKGQAIVRVDRSEPSKNVLRGLRVFELLLERFSDLRGRVTLLQFLVPSRSELGVYQTYTDEAFEIIESINDEYGDVDWQPVHVFYENNYAQAIAGMSLYDVLFVNPVIDGMNLVSKEGPLVNENDGVLVLSELAGSYEQLSEHALGVTPTDLEGSVRALYKALVMPRDERRRRAATLKRLIQEEDIVHWLERQLHDLMTASTGAL